MAKPNIFKPQKLFSFPCLIGHPHRLMRRKRKTLVIWLGNKGRFINNAYNRAFSLSLLAHGCLGWLILALEMNLWLLDYDYEVQNCFLLLHNLCCKL